MQYTTSNVRIKRTKTFQNEKCIMNSNWYADKILIDSHENAEISNTVS